MVELRAQSLLGFVALSCGDARAARLHLEPAQAAVDERQLGELSIYHVTSNLLLTLILDGDLDRAEALARRVEAAGAAAGRTWHRSISLRTAAQVAAGRGCFDEALTTCQEALAAASLLPQPFEHARTLLAVGEIQRRAKRRGDARASLSAALDRFDALGAPMWADKAAAEIARLGGRNPSTSTVLSATEARIAELAAQGHTNREIAATMFVSLRTVESNLSRIYTKLGVRSRAGLAALHATGALS
jgi:DNA-binding CsgD family transcriptional regulator